MKGHEQLHAMRCRCAVPSIVFVETDPAMWCDEREWHVEHPQRAQVRVEPKDAPHRLDLRCLVGLVVHVNGTDIERVDAVARACAEAKASRVIAFVADRASHEVTHIADTEGHLQWPT